LNLSTLCALLGDNNPAISTAIICRKIQADKEVAFQIEAAIFDPFLRSADELHAEVLSADSNIFVRLEDSSADNKTKKTAVSIGSKTRIVTSKAVFFNPPR
jgi:hypothetical protein